MIHKIHELQVHCEKGSNNGIITNNDTIYLTNNQAILIDDKLIVVPENVNYTDDAIEALTEFQERFFEHVIIR